MLNTRNYFIAITARYRSCSKIKGTTYEYILAHLKHRSFGFWLCSSPYIYLQNCPLWSRVCMAPRVPIIYRHNFHAHKRNIATTFCLPEFTNSEHDWESIKKQINTRKKRQRNLTFPQIGNNEEEEEQQQQQQQQHQEQKTLLSQAKIFFIDR